jgi:hypothetical protein
MQDNSNLNSCPETESVIPQTKIFIMMALCRRAAAPLRHRRIFSASAASSTAPTSATGSVPPAQIIDGQKIAQQILDEIASAVRQRQGQSAGAHDAVPGLAGACERSASISVRLARAGNRQTAIAAYQTRNFLICVLLISVLNPCLQCSSLVALPAWRFAYLPRTRPFCLPVYSLHCTLPSLPHTCAGTSPPGR